MGGSAGQTFSDVATLGLDRLGGTVGKTFSGIGSVINPANALISLGGGVGRTVAGLGTPAKTARDQAEVAEQRQMSDAEKLRKQLLQAPKNIAPDNFLADKNRQLANLRLGLASTMTGAGGAPAAVLSSPSLTAGGSGKTKLGQ